MLSHCNLYSRGRQLCSVPCTCPDVAKLVAQFQTEHDKGIVAVVENGGSLFAAYASDGLLFYTTEQKEYDQWRKKLKLK